VARASTAIVNVELDLGRYELRRRGHRVKLEKKPMELLIFLVSRREQLVSREEIVAKLWSSNLFVDVESSVNNIVRKIRTALGDDSEKPRFVETVVGKGYRFIGPVHVIAPQFPQSVVGTSTATGKPEKLPGWSERASLAVMPLFLIGSHTDDQGLSLGFVDALIARLGNLQGVDVLPSSEVLTSSAAATAGEIAARLGVRFVLRGAMQFSKRVWRISLELFDSARQSTCFARETDIELARMEELENEIARQIANALNRPLTPARQRLRRYSKDALAYSEFMRGYQLSSGGDPTRLEDAALHLTNAVTRDPGFSLAHAVLSFVCATRHFEMDPTSLWLEKAEFHCHRALELDPELAEGHVASAFLLWGPSKNFQHLEAIAELKRALALQNNLPHAYNRLATILAHIGLLEQAKQMYERGRPFQPQKAVSHSIVQAYVWSCQYDRAREENEAWRAESPTNKYPIYFALNLAMLTESWSEAEALMAETKQLLPEEPMILSLQGLLHARMGSESAALDCMAKACAIPKSFGHAHHTYYQIAGILSVLGRQKAAFEWLERSVSTGFACWPFFLKDPCVENLRELSEFESLVSSLQARYPDHLGLL
jgi:DNA-binding winged helix-turn-helix (wHTH) protein/tetratricopeptide (TPR) repeat protein